MERFKFRTECVKMKEIHYIVSKVRGSKNWCVALADMPDKPIPGTVFADKKKCLKIAAAREDMALKDYMKIRKETT